MSMNAINFIKKHAPPTQLSLGWLLGKNPISSLFLTNDRLSGAVLLCANT